MTKLERTPEKLILQAGSITVMLDKSTGKAIMQRKLLFWARKPLERPLSDIAEVQVDTSVDPASRAEFFNTMLRMRSGGAWQLSAANRTDAETTAAAVRDFVGNA